MGNCKSKKIDLYDIKFDDIPYFSFENIFTQCKVVNVYDGDTISIIFYYNDKPIKVHFRMFGYDCPEMKPNKTLANRDLHIKCANIAKEVLEKKILNKICWVKFCKEEKYGRTMGYIYLDNNNLNNSVNKWMIHNGYGKEYFGNKKEDFSENELNNIINISEY